RAAAMKLRRATQGTTAARASSEAGQEESREAVALWGLAVTRLVVPADAARQTSGGLLQSAAYRLPQLVGHNPYLGRIKPDPPASVTIALLLRPGPDRLLRPVPDAHARVQLPVQHLADGGVRPAVRARRRHPLRVQRLGDPYETKTSRVHLEYSAHDV